MRNQDAAKRRRALWQNILGGLAVLFIVLAPIHVPFVVFFLAEPIPVLRSLPSDEEMIAHFYKHRADFERLSQIYREDLSVRTTLGYLEPTPEIKAMMDRINVSHVVGDDVLWIPPGPYSVKPDFLKEKSRLGPKWWRKFSGVVFAYAHGRVIRIEYLEPVYKEYYYLPVVPKMRDGMLDLPRHGWGRVYQTLNRYPPNFETFDAVYRQIEPHWFIRMYQDKY